MTASLFQGKDVILRPFAPEDVPVLSAYLNHPDLTGRRYLPGNLSEHSPLSLQQVEKVMQKWNEVEEGLNLAVVLRQGAELIGHAEADWGWDPHNPSVSVVIAPSHQQQGYGSQVIRLLLGYLFDYTPAYNVTCWIADWNRPACEFAAHQGFRACGRMRRAGIRQGAYFDVLLMDLVRPEWQQRGGARDAS